MIKPVNWELVSNPLNWVIIFLMLLIAGYFGSLFFSYLGIEPSLKGQVSSYNAVPVGQIPGQQAVDAITPQQAGL